MRVTIQIQTDAFQRLRMMNMRRLWRVKTRGVTPVIATVLLIGLVVIAGIAVALVVFGTINTPAPIDVEILSISGFQTTDSNTLIDQFSVTLQNDERTDVRIEPDAFTLELFETVGDDTPIIPGWRMSIDQSFILSARAIETIILVCDPFEGVELTPDEDIIYIEVKVYPKDSTNERLARIFRSDILSIGSTHGPIFVEYETSTMNLEAAGLTINFSVINNGSADQVLDFELFTDSPERITFAIDAINRTTFSFSLSGYGSTILNATIFPTDKATLDDTYLVLVFLWSQENFQLVASMSIIMSYVG
ncbi:MAG: archaellin/type IV pilin N-terminal domain-containing protein [Promethearchaeota archaeon]